VPPLRERRDEIVPLAEKFIVKHGKAGGGELPPIPTLLRQALMDYPWPGNVRELENVVRKFLVFRQPEALAAELWGRMAERRQGVGSGTVVKMPPRSAPVTSTARNGSNGVEGVKIHQLGNGAANGAAASVPPAVLSMSERNHAESGAGSEQHYGSLHFPNSNGKSGAAEPEYAPFGARHADTAESHHGGKVRSFSGFVTGDEFSHEDALQNGLAGHADLEVPGFKNGEQLSTLAQVEELSKEFERRTILAALQRSTWNRKKAAKMLDIDYKGLLYKMKKLEIA
jgi:DNA-binding NtrC family response regulator